MAYRDQSNGGQDNGTPVNVYGYTVALNPSYVLQSLTLPSDTDLEVSAITLSNVTLALPEAPAISAQPQSALVTNGNPAEFTVAAWGSPTLTYQWQWNGTNLSNQPGLSGVESPSLLFSSAVETNAGSYQVIVANSYGSVTSLVATLTVVPPPVVFQSAVLSNNFIDFTWSAPPGLTCQVQYNTNLASTNWLPLGPAQTAGNGVLTASDATQPDAQRFYRVLILP
jgi:hypothetical protein